MKTEYKIYEQILKPEYYISEDNLKLIEANRSKIENFNIEKDQETCDLVALILEQSISEIDHRLNWKDRDIYTKRQFLLYYLYPIHIAENHTDVLKIVYNQHSTPSAIRNSILLMFDLDYTGTYPKKVKVIESLDTVIKRKFKHLSNKALVNRINNAHDFCWDDEGYEIERRVKASNGKLKVKMNVNTLEIV